jgi:hypothetical protein
MPLLSAPAALRRRTHLTLATIGVVSVAVLGAQECSSAAAATLTRGFSDTVWVSPGVRSQTTQEWARNVYASGARIAEVEVDWSEYEPTRAATGSKRAKADSPANRAYGNWSALDRVVHTLTEAHVQVLFMVTAAPAWAEANHGRDSSTEGYEPNDHALRDFMQALATRYDGHYRPSKKRGHPALPRVRYYQDWAEANLQIKLAPEWTRVHGQWVNTGATIYRNMLNSFYAGVKAASRSDKVIFTGLEAYGSLPTKSAAARVSPVTFLANVLCLGGHLQKVCNTPTHFDIMAADPYDVGSPNTHALNYADASAPDLGRLRRVLRAAARARTIVPGSPKPFWVTEFSYDSNPPNPTAISTAKQARWLEDSFYVFWKEDVSDVFWYLIRDSAGDDYSTRYYSGIYFHNATKKPSFTAYRFPLVVAADRSRAQIWGIAPKSGEVLVQRRVGTGWKTVMRVHRKTGAVFSGYTARSAHGAYRAVIGTASSLVWTY